MRELLCLCRVDVVVIVSDLVATARSLLTKNQ